MPFVLGLYVRRWVRWAGGGLGSYKKNPAVAGSFLVPMDKSSLTHCCPHILHQGVCQTLTIRLDHPVGRL